MFDHRSLSFLPPIHPAVDIITFSVYDLPPMPAGEYAARPGAGEQGDRLQSALQTVAQGIGSILSSKGFGACLKTLARFRSYSPSNVVPIWTKSKLSGGGTAYVVPSRNRACQQGAEGSYTCGPPLRAGSRPKTSSLIDTQYAIRSHDDQASLRPNGNLRSARGRGWSPDERLFQNPVG